MSGYTPIYTGNPSDYSLGTPTIDPSAVVGNLNNTTPTGISAAAATGASSVAVPTPTGPTTGIGGANAPSTPGFFAQGGIGQFALGTIHTLGSLWNSFQQNKVAKQSMAFQRDAFNQNMVNQKQTYNTALEDRINARYVTEGKSQAEAQSYIDKNKL